MKNRIANVGLISTLLIVSSSFLYADADENFVTVEGAVNLTFIESIAKNRAHNEEGESSKYMKIDGNEEFMEALKSGKFNDVGDGSRIKTDYVYRDIQNVDLDDRDLKDIDGDTLNLGSQIDGGNIKQSLNIKNSTIETDKHINAGVSSSSDDVSGITSITNIDNSELSGGDSDDEGISTSKYFD